jgi:autotransporter-associated beta strand protein
LTLSGTNTYTGGTTVNGGNLYVTGSVASNVTLNSMGVLLGSGVVNGNVTANIHTAVSTEFGALSITGNFTATPSTVLAIQIGSPLRVGGTATLSNSGLSMVTTSGYVVKALEPVVIATGGLSGTFDNTTVVFPGGIYTSGTLSYTPTEADVALSRTSVASVALASMPNIPTTQQTAQHIEGALRQADQWAVSAPADHAAFLNSAGQFLHATSIAQAAASIDSLSGQLLASSQGLTMEQAGILNRTVADRLADLGSDGFGSGAWFQGTGAGGDIARSGYATGSYSGGGSLAGYDLAVADGVTLGAALDWSRLASEYTMQAGSSTSRTSGAMLYGQVTGEHAYLVGRVGQDWVSSTVQRWATLGDTPAQINSSRQDRLTSVYLEGGCKTDAGAWSVTPFASFSATKLDRGAINEFGAGGFGITAGTHEYDQTGAQLGAHIAYQLGWNGGRTWLKGYALYQRLLSGSGLSFTAAYAGAPSATFQLEGVNSPRNSDWVGVGLTTVLNKSWSWFANLDGQVGGRGTKATVLSAGVLYRF